MVGKKIGHPLWWKCTLSQFKYPPSPTLVDDDFPGAPPQINCHTTCRSCPGMRAFSKSMHHESTLSSPPLRGWGACEYNDDHGRTYTYFQLIICHEMPEGSQLSKSKKLLSALFKSDECWECRWRVRRGSMSKSLRIQLEVDVHAVTCPGVW